MKANQRSMRAFTQDNGTPFKIIFLKNETKIYTKSKGLGVVNYVGLYVWTLALGLFLPWN